MDWVQHHPMGISNFSLGPHTWTAHRTQCDIFTVNVDRSPQAAQGKWRRFSACDLLPGISTMDCRLPQVPLGNRSPAPIGLGAPASGSRVERPVGRSPPRPLPHKVSAHLKLIKNVPAAGHDSLYLHEQGVYIVVDFLGGHSTRHTFTNQLDWWIKIAQPVKK